MRREQASNYATSHVTETVERTCYRHPDRITGLSCSECGRPICTECMTMAPVGIRCPEHAGGQRVVDRSRAFSVGGRVTQLLIAINVGVYLAELLTGGGVQGDRGWIFDHGVLFGPFVAAGDWWRLITSAFMHYGPFHLLLNMYGVYFAGTLLERAIGGWRFLMLYIVSGLAGSAGALLWKPNAFTVGASGALFGILGALFVLERRGHLATEGQIAGLIVINLIFTVAFARYIAVGGHFGGLIGGIVSMFLLMQVRGNAARSAVALGAVGVIAVVVAYSAI
jgi:membrane associated rhomboid family serine protease